MLKLTNLPAGTTIELVKGATHQATNIVQQGNTFYVFSGAYKTKAGLTEAFPEAKQDIVDSDNKLY